jgi:sugar fermentation stimulation protein A
MRKPHVAFPKLVPASFVARPNRFLVLAEVEGVIVRAASRDPGRLTGVLVPGTELRLEAATNPARATAFTVVLARHRRRWICLIPALANQVFAAALMDRAAPGLKRARVLEREVPFGHSRFDFRLAEPGGIERLVEVKSVACASGRLGLFPDAPTTRGRRHVEELIRHRERGGEAGLVFIAQRSDIDAVAPHMAIDPEFGHALQSAQRAGVLILAYGCRVTLRGCWLERQLPVLFPIPAPAASAP